MGLISKEGYEAKERYAQKRMEENAKIETLTEEQHNALAWLCAVRHEMHTNKKAFFNSENANNSKFYEYIDTRINEVLSGCELPCISWTISTFDIVSDIDYYELLDADEQTDDKYDELLSECYDQVEQINKDIENYLRKIDKQHKTNYCPTGATRI